MREYRIRPIHLSVIVFVMILLILTVLWTIGLIRVGGGPVIVH